MTNHVNLIVEVYLDQLNKEKRLPNAALEELRLLAANGRLNDQPAIEEAIRLEDESHDETEGTQDKGV